MILFRPFPQDIALSQIDRLILSDGTLFIDYGEFTDGTKKVDVSKEEPSKSGHTFGGHTPLAGFFVCGSGSRFGQMIIRTISLLFLFLCTINAQIALPAFQAFLMERGPLTWVEHTIDGSYDGATSVFAADMDNDGDMDILGTAYIDDDITWWESK